MLKSETLAKIGGENKFMSLTQEALTATRRFLGVERVVTLRQLSDGDTAFDHQYPPGLLADMPIAATGIQRRPTPFHRWRTDDSTISLR